MKRKKIKAVKARHITLKKVEDKPKQKDTFKYYFFGDEVFIPDNLDDTHTMIKAYIIGTEYMTNFLQTVEMVKNGIRKRAILGDQYLCYVPEGIMHNGSLCKFAYVSCDKIKPSYTVFDSDKYWLIRKIEDAIEIHM